MGRNPAARLAFVRFGRVTFCSPTHFLKTMSFAFRCRGGASRYGAALVFLLFLFTATAHAQEEPPSVGMSIDGVGLRIGGTFQPRLSFGFESGGDDNLQRLGFGLRRARLRMTATFGRGFSAYYDLDAGGGRLSSVQLHGQYKPNPVWRFRFGYVGGAQPRAYTPTSHTRIDAIERAAISERWARGTIGSSGRDFGVEAQYEAGGATIALYLHNGDGSFDRARSNFRESVSGLSATRGTERTALAVSGAASYEPAGIPGLEIGAYGSYNPSQNPNTALGDSEQGREYVSYAGHLYWGAAPGSQPLRLKADVIGIVYEEGATMDVQHSLGYAALAAARVFGHGEVFVRGERYYTFLDEGDADSFVTAGLSYSLSARRGLPYRQERLTLAYANGLPANDGADQHLIVLQLQFVF